MPAPTAGQKRLRKILLVGLGTLSFPFSFLVQAAHIWRFNAWAQCEIKRFYSHYRDFWDRKIAEKIKARRRKQSEYFK
jgi:hypothetical protein